MQPLSTSVFASLPCSSFWVAHGSATSQATPHGVWPSWNVAFGKASTYSEIRPRRLVLWSLTHWIFSWSIPSGSCTKPWLSESVSTVPPSWFTFSAAWVATLPDPEITARLPVRPSPRVASMLARK